MLTSQIQFASDGRTQWAGMADLVLVSPDGKHLVALPYTGEPPHGDSYHTATIDGKAFPGLVWGCLFAFSSCSRYFVCSWMARKFERATAVIDLDAHRYFVLPQYIYKFRISWPSIVGEGESSSDQEYTFEGSEQWLAY